jgi:hypothetical protein
MSLHKRIYILNRNMKKINLKKINKYLLSYLCQIKYHLKVKINLYDFFATTLILPPYKLSLIWFLSVLKLIRYFLRSKVLNSGRGQGRGRVKDFAISAVMTVALRITVVTVWINHNIAQILLKLLYYNICITT